MNLKARALGRPVPARGWGQLSQASRPPLRALAEGWCGPVGLHVSVVPEALWHKAVAVSCQQIQADKPESSTVGYYNGGAFCLPVPL